jgi:hypothetical protein
LALSLLLSISRASESSLIIFLERVTRLSLSFDFQVVNVLNPTVVFFILLDDARRSDKNTVGYAHSQNADDNYMATTSSYHAWPAKLNFRVCTTMYNARKIEMDWGEQREGRQSAKTQNQRRAP